MIPGSGIYLMVHLFIIGSVRIFKFASRGLGPVLIILLVLILISYSVTRVIGSALRDGNNMDYYHNLTYRCEEFSRQSNKNKIVIRVDDVQAYWLTEIQTAIINELEKRRLPASFSVIPFGLTDDKKMTTLLNLHNCHFEYTLHGWDQGRENGYQSPEFGMLNKDEAGERIDRGLEVMKKISDKQTITFVPPNNAYSAGTRDALLERGFRVVSAEQGGYFDYTATTYNYAEMHAYSTDETLEQCKKSLNKNNLCILMTHPQDFATADNKLDQVKFNEFIRLLNSLDELSVEFTTFSALKDWYHTIPMPPEMRNEIKPANAVSTELKENKKECKEGYKNVLATKFWVGEVAGQDNGFIPNKESAWDDQWLAHYGGVDDPDNRCGYKPCAFNPNENPFYFALPFNDLDDDGRRKESAAKIPWVGKVASKGSVLKNRWLEIKYNNKICYAQWEDVGPFSEDDFNYVFGNAVSTNKDGVGAGLDLSPATWDCLGLVVNDYVDWRFVEAANVPNGPWKEIVTKSIGYEVEIN